MLPQKTVASGAAALLIIVIAGLYIIKKRSGVARRARQPSAGADRALLVQQCRRERRSGDFATFYATALTAARALIPEDRDLHSLIAQNLERARFSSLSPSAEDADHVLRQLECALDRTDRP